MIGASPRRTGAGHPAERSPFSRAPGERPPREPADREPIRPRGTSRRPDPDVTGADDRRSGSFSGRLEAPGTRKAQGETPTGLRSR